MKTGIYQIMDSHLGHRWIKNTQRNSTLFVLNIELVELFIKSGVV